MKLSEVFSYGPLVRLEQLIWAVDREVRWPRGMRRRHEARDMSTYECRVSSQHGEDGILEELTRRLGIVSGYFVEFGVGDGRECNCAKLVSDGAWGGLMIEAGERDHAAAERRYAAAPGVAVRQAFVSVANLEGLFVEAGVPVDFDVLSIDVDGNDYWLWRSLVAFRPKIVVIEFNAFFAPPERWVLPYDPAHRWNRDWRFGASLAALETLGAERGYALIGCDGSATNAFFVRNELLAAVDFPSVSSEEAYAAATKFRHFSRSKAGMPFANGYA
jgi:hypothetical protein